MLDTGCKLSCGDDYTLDEANCECKCSKTCDSDYTLDEDSCSCSCSKTCEDGYTLDEDTCSCVADSSSDSDDSDDSYTVTINLSCYIGTSSTTLSGSPAAKRTTRCNTFTAGGNAIGYISVRFTYYYGCNNNSCYDEDDNKALTTRTYTAGSGSISFLQYSSRCAISNTSNCTYYHFGGTDDDYKYEILHYYGSTGVIKEGTISTSYVKVGTTDYINENFKYNTRTRQIVE